MCTKEVEERGKALLVLEQLGWQVTIEKLHTITDWFRQRRLGKGGIERLEIQLEGECVRAGIKRHEIKSNQLQRKGKIVKVAQLTGTHQYIRFFNKALLEFEVLSDGQLLDSQLADIDTDIVPYTGSRTDCKGNPWSNNNCFLIYTSNREIKSLLDSATD